MICEFIDKGMTEKQARFASMLKYDRMNLEQIANQTHTPKSCVSECLSRAVKVWPDLAELIPKPGRPKSAFKIFKPQSHIISNH